jgi:hypothetical protein
LQLKSPQKFSLANEKSNPTTGETNVGITAEITRAATNEKRTISFNSDRFPSDTMSSDINSIDRNK